MIRNATPADFERVLPLFEKAHEESIFKGLELNEVSMRRTFVTLAVFEKGYARVIERNNQIVGCLVGCVSENQFGAIVAQDLFNYSERGTHLLIKDFIRWAKGKDAVFVQITDYSKQERYGHLLERIGLKPAAVNYLEVL